jgi:hypothetical protein
LTQLQIPAGLPVLVDVFKGVAKLERLVLLGSAFPPALVASVECCLAPAAKVISAALVGQTFGGWTIAAA